MLTKIILRIIYIRKVIMWGTEKAHILGPFLIPCGFLKCGPRENRTPASAMRMRCNATLLWAQNKLLNFTVGVLGIGPSLPAPKAGVLPVYDTPPSPAIASFGGQSPMKAAKVGFHLLYAKTG